MFRTRRVFKQLGVKVDVHATPNSYCDGEYNLNIDGKKWLGQHNVSY